MNKEYNLKLDLQFKCNNSKMIFDEFDENTSDFFMQINRQGEKIDISNAIPTLLVLKPSGVAVSQILEVKNNIIYGNLNNSLKNEVGTYIAKLMLVEGDKKIFISNISYEVTENALLGKIDNDILEDERYSVLVQLIERLSDIESKEQDREEAEQNRQLNEQNREKTIQDIQNKIDEALDKINNIGEGDFSTLATKEELNKLNKELEIHTHEEYATKEEVPTKISELENDKKYLTKIPSEYVTEMELNQKGYLTEHQDISHLATKKELFSKDYNDLTNKPTIPSIDGLATKIYVNEEIKKIDVTGQLGDYAKKSELHNHTNKTVLDGITSAKVQSWDNKSTFNGDYNSLINKPTIPSIEGLATKDYVNNEINKIDVTSQLGDYAKKSDIPVVPTNISAFINDKGYITEIPSEYITEAELNAKGYLTQHQDISGKADKTELHNHTNKTVLDGITNAKVAEWNNKSTFDGNYNSLTNKPTIPTVSNDLTNALKSNYDKAYTHSQEAHAPSNAQKNSDITKAEIEAKLTGNITTHTHSQYLTQHQDISHLALKSELHNHSNKSVLDNITSSKVTEWNNKSTFSGNYNDLTNKPTIPTKTSQLNNDSNYLTSIPSEYVTESELIAKGYATQTELNNKLNKNFGSENVGKILAVGSDGNLALMDMPNGDIGGDIAGFVDGDNNIILMGALPNGTYVLKYENIDGTYTNIGDLVVETIVPPEPEPEPEPTFTNLAEYNATNTSDFTIWCNDSRMGGDGSYRSLAGYITSNYIEVSNGDVIRIDGIVKEDNYPSLGLFTSDKTLITTPYYLSVLATNMYITNLTETSTGATFTINFNDCKYIRFSGKPANGGENVIITKNEEII